MTAMGAFRSSTHNFTDARFQITRLGRQAPSIGMNAQTFSRTGNFAIRSTVN